MLISKGRSQFRKVILGLGLGLAVTAGLAACGSSTTSTGNTPANNLTKAPASTTPATTAPASGGVSY